jgi:hypothetical protein
MPTTKVMGTKNYRLFQRHNSENRPVDIKKHKKLVDSMKLYGFLRSFPIVVTRTRAGNLIVKDGQHRLLVAETLGLPVYYVEEEVDFDIAIVNSTAKVWVLRDYAEKYASNGIADYAEGIQFAEQHRLAIGTAFALLAGVCSFTAVQDEFVSGKWRVKDAKWANAVASIYTPLVGMSASLRNTRFVEACMAVCRVSEFRPDRLIGGAERCREKLVSYSTRDAFLDMLEVLYNFGRRDLFGLKSAALMAMKKRNPAIQKQQKKAAKVAA